MNRLLKRIAKIPFAPVVAAMFGLIFVTLVLMTPGWLFERMIVASGLPALIPAAGPPLGETARSLAAFGGGLGVFLALWVALAVLRALIKRNAPAKARGSRIDAVTRPVQPPVADARRKREPIFAERELGAPFMSDEAIAKVAETIPAAPSSLPSAAPAAEPEPLLPDRIAPAPAPEPTPSGPTVISELERLEAALDRRAQRGLATRPIGAGDIASLRHALRGLH